MCQLNILYKIRKCRQSKYPFVSYNFSNKPTFDERTLRYKALQKYDKKGIQ